MTRAERRMLEGVLALMPVPCRCQERFRYTPGDANAHHLTCEAEELRETLKSHAAPPDAQGGAPVAAPQPALRRDPAGRCAESVVIEDRTWACGRAYPCDVHPPAPPAAPGTEAAPRREGRCSFCGSQRIRHDDGTYGACTLVPGRDGKGGCPAPLGDFDYEQGTGRSPGQGGGKP